MTKNIKLFLLVILASLPFWWGINVFQRELESFLWLNKITKEPPYFFIAHINQNYKKTKKIFQSPTHPSNCQISAESAISVEIDKTGTEKIIFKKQDSQKMTIASLTKLMTAIVALEFYHLSDHLAISKESIQQDGAAGNLMVGEILKVEDLLKIMLIESSNDAAYALSEPAGVDGFIYLMNKKAEEIGLNDTYFFNPTGLEPTKQNDQANYSTAKDLVKIAKYLIFKQPLILDIISHKEYPLYFNNGNLRHILKNTNELLGEKPEIIGGKTGWTEKAGGCLLLILTGKNPESYIINVVLNSPDRFADMRKLINCYH